MIFEDQIVEDSRAGAITRFYRSHLMLIWFVAFVAVPLFVAVLLGHAYLAKSLRPDSGQYLLAEVQQPFSIARNDRGVAHIRAVTDRDAFFAVGFAHAQDRLWQMELQRRLAQGRLSEIFGKTALQSDIFMRTLGIYAAAEEAWTDLGDPARDSLLAYAEGVNAWIETTALLPTEFVFLNIEPEPWTPADSLAWVKVFALSLGSNFRQELDNLLLAGVLDPAHLASLKQGAPPATSPAGSAAGLAICGGCLDEIERLAALGQAMETQWQVGGRMVGSNAWAVSGEYGEDGLTVLANDPHLGLALPSMWYAVTVQGGEIDVAGMSLVGLPLVLLGRNRHIAWGATNMMADTQDLFFERLSTDGTDRFFYDGQWRDLHIREETFHIKADFPAFMRERLTPITLRVRSTENGPLISDIVGAVEQPMSLRWTGAGAKDTSYEAFLELNYARNWQEFKRAMSKHVAPAMNLLYADDKNNIGYLGVGRIPVRTSGQGSEPLNGWQKDSAWAGQIPFESMPESFNPERGYLISANHRMVEPSYPYFISNDWAEPARAERIGELIEDKLQAGEKLTFADHEAIQTDTVDRQALALLPHLLAIEPQDKSLEVMLDYLAQWDGSTDKDSVAATIFFAWAHHLRIAIFSDEIAGEWGKSDLNTRLQRIVHNIPLKDLSNALTNDAIDWCNDIGTSEVEDCHGQKLEALKRTYDDLRALLGGDIDNWTWARAHKAEFVHQPFSSVRGLDFLYGRDVPSGGSLNSISVSDTRFTANEGFVQSYGAGFRQIMQAGGAGTKHRYVNSTGQSGNVLSEHYDDMMESYANGEYFDLDCDEISQLTRVTVVQGKVNVAYKP